MINEFPDLKQYYDEEKFSDLEKRLQVAIENVKSQSDEKVMRSSLAEVREIHDLISESEIVYQAGLEYLNNFELYQKVEQDPEALEKMMQEQQDRATAEKNEIQGKKFMK